MLIVVIASVIVFLAMSIDLGSGLYKAKLRGDLRTSKALKRTITKFITYEGSILIAAGVDLLMHLSRLMYLFNLEAIYGVPVITCLVGVFLLAVEFISIREKADTKTKKQMDETAAILAEALKNETLKEMIKTALDKQDNKED